MVVGIGCDVVDHIITRELDWASNVRRRERIFSPNELALLEDQNPVRFLSGRYAAKEAVLKCLGSGMIDGIALTDIQVLQTAAGRPTIQINGALEIIVQQLGVVAWHISISHTTNSSTAFVIAEGKIL